MKDPASPFPDPRRADAHGLVAIGGSFSPPMLLDAYARGIFPWPSPGMPYAWFSPDPRMVLAPDDFRPDRSVRRLLRRGTFRVTFDTAFDAVVDACAAVPRSDQDGTWIVAELRDAFCDLHRLGWAHSAEAWEGDELVGGLYGLQLGAMFCGESMFHTRSNASKVAFAALVAHLVTLDTQLVDCQVYTEHLERLGAREVPRDRFLAAVERAVAVPSDPVSWRGVEPPGSRPAPLAYDFPSPASSQESS